MSVLFYKFKSAKAFDTINFDGPGISVFDLKRDIMIQKKLGKATDFDLYVYNAQTNDEYDDDAFVIQRNTSVLVARLAVPKGARLNAQRYMNSVVPILPKQQTQRPVYTKQQQLYLLIEQQVM